VALLVVEDLVKTFPVPHSRDTVKAVSGVSFAIERGEAFALIGESGSGKTTVARCILRLIKPDSGRVTFHGEDLLTLRGAALRATRRGIQMVFQDPGTSLHPRMSVRTTLREPIELWSDARGQSTTARIQELLEMVRLSRTAIDKYPHQLSAGEQQQVSFARALAMEPEIVVLDEPTSALDPNSRLEIIKLLIGLQRSLNIALLFISHDLTVVRSLTQRVAVMYLGKIVEAAETDAIFERPLHPYSRALIASVLHPDPERRPESFQLKGEIPSAIHLPAGCALYSRCPMAVPACAEAPPPLEEVDPGRWSACYRATEVPRPTREADEAAAR
jgi:oligopeptide/dipeptide ABC transporter ATP-binding protein